MIYIDISVESVDDAVDFYSKKLGVFDIQGNERLICNIGTDFIVDLYQVGTDRHRKVFERDSHVIASFWISPPDMAEDGSLNIVKRLQEHAVHYDEVKNLGGHSLSFKDPSGNKFMLWANHGVIV